MIVNSIDLTVVRKEVSVNTGWKSYKSLSLYIVQVFMPHRATISLHLRHFFKISLD